MKGYDPVFLLANTGAFSSNFPPLTHSSRGFIIKTNLFEVIKMFKFTKSGLSLISALLLLAFPSVSGQKTTPSQSCQENCQLPSSCQTEICDGSCDTVSKSQSTCSSSCENSCEETCTQPNSACSNSVNKPNCQKSNSTSGEKKISESTTTVCDDSETIVSQTPETAEETTTIPSESESVSQNENTDCYDLEDCMNSQNIFEYFKSVFARNYTKQNCQNSSVNANGSSSSTPAVSQPQSNSATSEVNSSSQTADNDYSTEILELVNTERRKAGLKPLRYCSEAQKAADQRAEEIVRSFSHTRPDGRSCFTVFDDMGIKGSYMCAENIAYGYPSAKAVMDGWMNSSGHRSNILSTNATAIAVGKVGTCWVQVFAHDN